LKDLIEEEYEIKSGDKIEKNIKKLKSSDTQELINSELKRKKFIEKNYKHGQYTIIQKLDEVLNQIDTDSIDYKDLTSEQQQVIFDL